MRSFAYLLILAIISASQSAHAFELATHARITNEALNKSKLATDAKLLNDLGFAADALLGDSRLGKNYFDVSGASIYTRSSDPFESSLKRMAEGVDPLSVQIKYSPDTGPEPVLF